MKPKLTIDKEGSKKWLLNKLLHRENGPAFEPINGSKFWFINGQLHRTDGPAIEYTDGSKFWYINNQLFTEQQWLDKTLFNQVTINPL